MKESWNSYYLLVVAGATSLIFPGTLYLLARWFRSTSGQPPTVPTTAPLLSSGMRRMNPRFLLALNAGLSLIFLGVALFPVSAGFQSMLQAGGRQEIFQVLSLLLLFTLFLSLGLLYASRKGDFDWLR